MIRLSKSCISDKEKEAVLNVLEREYLGMGSEVEKFEKELAIFFSRQTACVATGTAALQLALQGCKISKGDEVLVPSLTYLASFQSILALGAKPVACDIDSSSFLLDIKDVEKRITEKTKAIMPVHYSGGVGNLESIYKLANKHRLRVIEDAAHAFGTTYNDKLVGSFGDIACFSFDGIKNITSGEGGCVVTDDQKVINAVMDARLLGVKRDTEKRFNLERSWNFDVTDIGWRYHMSNIMAAIGIQQLKRFPNFKKSRQNFAKKYDQLFANHQIIRPLERDYENVVPHIYVVRIKGMKNREVIKQMMYEKNIEVGYHYYPNHLLTLFKDDNNNSLKNTEKYFPELLTLPLHPDLTFDNIEYVALELIKIIDNKNEAI